MTLFEEIVSSLILEDVSVSRVNDSINNTYEVEINYHTNGEDIATGKRIIQPHAYGLTKVGNPVIRAFQPYGDTTTKVPSWKFFRLDRIDSWMPYPDRPFTEAPGNFNAEGEFNKDGDKTMSMVYNIANFGNDTNINYSFIDNNGPIRKTNKNTSFKTDTERGLDNLKKQLDNPKYISDLVGTKNFGDNEKQPNSGPIRKQELSKKTQKTHNKDTENTQEPQTNNTLSDVFKTDTEREIEKRQTRLDNPQYVSQDVMDRYNQEKNKKRKNNLNNGK